MVCLKLIYVTLSIVPGKCNCYTAENCIAGEKKQKKKKVSIGNLQVVYGRPQSGNKESNSSNRKIRRKALNLKLSLVTASKGFKMKTMSILIVISTSFGHKLRLKYGRWVISGGCLGWFLLSPCIGPAMPFSSPALSAYVYPTCPGGDIRALYISQREICSGLASAVQVTGCRRRGSTESLRFSYATAAWP